MDKIPDDAPTWVVDDGKGIHHLLTYCSKLKKQEDESGLVAMAKTAGQAKDESKICRECLKEYSRSN